MPDLDTLPGRGIKPLVSLLAHRRLALAAGLLVLLAGLPLVLFLGQPYYQASTLLQVAPRYMKNLRDDGELSFPSNTQYREFLEQQTRSVLRYDIVLDALRSLGPGQAAWRRSGESERLTVDRLRELLKARAIPDTYMIEISLESGRKEGMAELLNAIARVYVERMKGERIFGADVRQRNLELRESALLQTLRQKTAQRTELALQLGVTTFGDNVENPYDRVLAGQRNALSEAQARRFEAEAKWQAFQATGETDLGTRSVQEAVLIDPGLANLKSNLYRRRADLLTQLEGLTAQHPAYADLRGEIQAIDSEIESQRARLQRQVEGSLRARHHTALAQSQQVEAALAREVAAYERKGARFAALFNQALSLSHELEQDRKELDVIRERLNEFAAEANSFGFVRLVTPALVPETPRGTGKRKLLLGLLLAAGAAALLLPIGLDLTDRRLHTVNDAERVLGMPALGWLLESRDAASSLFSEDLLRRLAGALLREQEQHGTHVFAFSAIKPGAGTSHLVLALARTLDQLGYPALALEANAFKPDARWPGAPGQPGLAQCLAGLASLAAAVQPASQHSAARLAVGSGGGQHLDQLHQLPALAAAARAQFRFVLTDIPPLLLSADAELLASSLQHLVLVVEAGQTQSGELRRAARLVEKLAPAAVGLVVNRVHSFAGGGYLHEMLVEYLTRRKAAAYFTQPGWLTALRARRASLRWPLFRRMKA